MIVVVNLSLPGRHDVGERAVVRAGDFSVLDTGRDVAGGIVVAVRLSFLPIVSIAIHGKVDGLHALHEVAVIAEVDIGPLVDRLCVEIAAAIVDFGAVGLADL